jgi:pilus assembly protein CpaE
MLRAIIIGAGEDTASRLNGLFRETGRFALIRETDSYPDEQELGRLIRAHAPQTVFLCVDDLSKALHCRDDIEQTVHGVPIVAFGQSSGENTLLELMKVGVRDFLPAPFRLQDLLDLADRIENQLAKHPLAVDSTDLMFSFLPAKPGVGASTLALNLSIAFSQVNNTRVLLNDFDLNSGLISFMLKLNPVYSVLDAIVRADDLDENLWPQLVSSARGVDVLPNGRPEPGVRIQPPQVHRMLAFARRQYNVICVDLSGNMEKYSIELMMESKRIFLVTTGEIPPLHLARHRMSLLRDLDLRDRINVLLNRWTKRSSISVEQVEDLLEAPVFETFPNSYEGVHRSLVAGAPVDPSTDLGRKFSGFARRIMQVGDTTAKKPKRSFLENFSLLPSMGRR